MTCVLAVAVLSLAAGEPALAFPPGGMLGPPLLVSQTPAGQAANGVSGVFGLAISGDGSAVAFSSTATDLTAATGTNPAPGIYVRRLYSGSTVLASATAAGEAGNALSTRPSLSVDGSRAAFLSSATNLDPADRAQDTDAYLKDLWSGAVRLVPAPLRGVRANGPASAVAIAGNGRSVAFVSRATNLDPRDTDTAPDVYVERRPGQVVLASVPASGAKPAPGAVGASGVSISHNGRTVAFSTDAALDPGDVNGRADVYVKDLDTGGLLLASATGAGVVGDAGSVSPVVTARGDAVAFATFATNLDPRDTETDSDIYLKDLCSGALTLVSTDSGGVKGDDSSSYPAVARNGRIVAFASYATNLGPKPPETWTMDVYVKDLVTGAVIDVSGPPPTEPSGIISLYPVLAYRGRSVAFVTNGGHLSTVDTNNVADVYLAQLSPPRWWAPGLGTKQDDDAADDGQDADPALEGDPLVEEELAD
jgi:Tol biopolymer transport system component